MNFTGFPRLKKKKRIKEKSRNVCEPQVEMKMEGLGFPTHSPVSEVFFVSPLTLSRCRGAEREEKGGVKRR